MIKFILTVKVAIY